MTAAGEAYVVCGMTSHTETIRKRGFYWTLLNGCDRPAEVRLWTDTNGDGTGEWRWWEVMADWWADDGITVLSAKLEPPAAQEATT